MHERLGEYERAIERFDEAIALDPAQGDVFREGELLKAWMRSRENRLPNLPERLRFVILGTTGLCNASCIHCPTGNAETAHTPQTPMPMPLFKKIVDGVRGSGIKVMTFSQLDRSNGVRVSNRIDVTVGRPSQITVQVSS